MKNYIKVKKQGLKDHMVVLHIIHINIMLIMTT